MTTTTPSHVAANVALAAAGWAGTSNLKSDHVRVLRLMRHTCAACGEALDETANVCHIVGATGGWGYVDHNVYVGHRSCNDIDREILDGDPFKILAAMVRPDLIFRTIPSRKEALAWAREHDTTEAIKARRLAARLAAANA